MLGTSRETTRTRRLLQLAGAALGFALLLALLYRRSTDTVTLDLVHQALRSPAGADSTFYMRMGERAFEQNGPRLYAQLFFSDHQKFIYPPSSLFLIEAVDGSSHVGLSPERVWKALMLAGWLASIAIGVLLFRHESQPATPVYKSREPVADLLSIAVLGVLFLPFAEAFFRGQVQMLLTALWGLSALLFARRRHGWSGAVLALTCAFKPQLAIFLLWGVARRKWRFTAGFAATGMAIAMASLLHFGLENHLDYLAVLRFLSRHGEALAANQSITGALDRLLRNGNASTWSYTVYPPYRAVVYVASTAFSALCLLVGLALPRRAGWSGTTLDFLFSGCLSVLMSPIAWEHHYGYFFFAMAVLLARAETFSPKRWLCLCAALLASSNRLPRLDGHVAGIASLAGDYLLFSGLVVLSLLASQASALPAPLVARNQRSPVRTGESAALAAL